MTIEEIRKNKPDGATHYRVLMGNVEYMKKLSYHDTWYLWWEFKGEWMLTFWHKVEIGKCIKPL